MVFTFVFQTKETMPRSHQQEATFDFTEITNNYGLKRETVC